MNSDSEDYIGAGVPYLFHPGSSTIVVESSGENVAIHVSAGDQGSWSLEFAPARGQTLAPGMYANAQRAPFREDGHPGLDVGGGGRGCNTLTGSFEVKAFDPAAQQIWILFEQHCSGNVPALYGEVRVNMPAPDGALVAPALLRWPPVDPGRAGQAVAAGVIADQPMTITGVGIEGAHAGDFRVRLDDCSGKALAPGALCQVFVQPLATGSGIRQAKLVLHDDRGRVREVALEAYAYRGVTRWHMVSDPGDFIGQGQTWSYSPLDGTRFEVVGDRQHVYVRIYSLNGHAWFANFGAPVGDILAPGTYAPARRYGFSDGAAGLDVTGEGRGCNEIAGSFTVNEITFDSSGRLHGFSITFEQHCEGAAPALRGTIEFRAGGGPPPVWPWSEPPAASDGSQPAGVAPPPGSTPLTGSAQETARCGGRTYAAAQVTSGSRTGDRLRGSAGSDVLLGRRGRDVLRGARAADCLAGGTGADRLYGGGGSDLLAGGPGRDLVVCGPGRDVALRGRGDRYRGCERVVTRRS